MLTPTLRRLLVTAAAATLVPLAALTPASPAGAVGPDCDNYDTILNGQYTLIPLKNQAMLTEERCGYRFRAGQQDSRIEVTERDGGLFFHDKGSASWKSVEAPCAKRSVTQGVAAWCPVPGDTSPSNPMLLEIWPRLGDDYLDASTLPAQFQLAALMDAGNDTVLGGAGHDFVNGAFGRDRIRGRRGQRLAAQRRPRRHRRRRRGRGQGRHPGRPRRRGRWARARLDLRRRWRRHRDQRRLRVRPGQLRHRRSDRNHSDRDDERRSCERVTTYVPDHRRRHRR